jgi:carbonic anhydrase
VKKLLDGIVQFRQDDFEAHKALFTSLKSEQKPHTLFISCSDSRVDPNLITKTLPGELFIIRNVANLVPPHRDTAEYVATTSAIEYAVLALEVQNIIVCGHSNCGGCASALNLPDTLLKMPHTRKWLELAKPAREKVLKTISNEVPEAQEWMMEQFNVIEQLRNLWSFPYVREKVNAGKLALAGWYYIIETGEVFVYDREQGAFLLANG